MRPPLRRFVPLAVFASVLGGSVAFAQEAARLPLHHAPEPTSAAISAADLMTRLYIFADDSMMGRLAGSAGDFKATSYIAAELKRLGLQGGGDGGTFFQDIPLYRSAPSPSMRISVGSARFVVGQDFIPINDMWFGRVPQIDRSRAVFGGTFGDTATMLGPSDGNERFVVVAASRDSAGRPQWGNSRQALTARFSGAVAVAITGLEAMDSASRAQLLQPQSLILELPAITGGPPGMFADDMFGAPVPAFLYITSAMAEQLLGRPVAGARAGQTGGIVQGNVDFKTQLIAARNVIGIVPGSDPLLKGQFVAIGAHSDHMGEKRPPVDHDAMRALLSVARSGGEPGTPPVVPLDDVQRIKQITDSLHALEPSRLDSVFNGANDGGSGAVAALEIAEAFADAPVKPKRSILFVWRTGDENGFAGSGWFVAHQTPIVSRSAIVAELNMDMIGGGDADEISGGGPGSLQVVGLRRLSTELGDLVDSVAASQPIPLRFDTRPDSGRDPLQLYCRGDQYSYARYGIPGILFTTGRTRSYRQVTDEPEYIDYAKLARVTSFVYDIARDVANLDHRIIVDKPKPNPLAACVQ
ncbi:MAG TPA: M28 family peptidase [Gemmatimonadaceae bacterium]|nr:M28 family peptidase [Gemmatimonadaceae bacterium]